MIFGRRSIADRHLLGGVITCIEDIMNTGHRILDKRHLRRITRSMKGANRSKSLFSPGSTLAVPVNRSVRLVVYPGSVRKSLNGLSRDRCGVGRTLHRGAAE